MRKSFMRPLLSHLSWLKNLLCYMIHYGTYRGPIVGLRGAVVGVRGAAVGSGAQLSAISAYLHTSYLGAQLSASRYKIVNDLNSNSSDLYSPDKIFDKI